MVLCTVTENDDATYGVLTINGLSSSQFSSDEIKIRNQKLIK